MIGRVIKRAVDAGLTTALIGAYVVDAFTGGHTMIQKVWLKHIWFIAGRTLAEGPHIDRAWLKTIYPPYLEGHGLSIRIGTYTARLGLCRVLLDIDDDIDDAGSIDIDREISLAGSRLTNTTAEEMRSWDI